jgi:hypothetical protein
VLDGALFAFVVGTDPEVWLALEARGSADEGDWHFALARMNADALAVELDGRQVWEAPAIDEARYDIEQPYCLLDFSGAEAEGAP